MVRRGLLLLAVIVLAPYPVSAQTVEDRARAAADASRSKTSDSDAIQQNYLTPGLAGQPISTVDNSQTFNPNIACRKTATLLELIAQPVATGDIGTLRIARDKDLDGAVDQILTLPVPVSGICANGVVSCQPGTWNECQSFKWDVASGGDLRLAQVDLTDLAGCYCVNNSCGSNLVWGNMASVLKDLGGGIIGALTTADPRVGVAQAVIDGPAIRYTGAQSTACSPDPALPQTAYRTSPAMIQSDASNLATSNSVFQALKGSPAGVGRVQQMRSCTITREVSLNAIVANDVIARTAGGYATHVYSSDSLGFAMGSPANHSLRGGNCTIFDFRMTLHVEYPDRLRDVRLLTLSADDWAQLRVNGVLVASGPQTWTGTGFPPGNCEKDGTFISYPNLDIASKLEAGDNEIWLRVAVADRGDADALIRATVDTSCDQSEEIVDLCVGNTTDAKCQLHDESVDGVETFRNGVGTGLTPLPQARLFESGGCSLSLARPWFERQRRYRCTVDTGSMPEPDLSRSAWIIDHSTETMLADRVKTSDGGYSTSSRPFALPDRGSVPACEPVCKTRAPAPNTAAAPDGVVGARQNAPTGTDTFYHACTAANGGHVCPVGPGEEIIAPCGCLDDFPEAVVMMQTIRLGGADMVCTRAMR